MFGLALLIGMLFTRYECNKRYDAMCQKKRDLREKISEKLSEMDATFYDREDWGREDFERHDKDKQQMTDTYERWIKEEQNNYNSWTLNYILLMVIWTLLSVLCLAGILVFK